MDEKRTIRHEKIKKYLGNILFFSLLVSTIFAFVRFLMAPSAVPAGAEYAKTKPDYLLTFIQCLMGMVVMMLPSMLGRKWNLSISSPIYILYYIFLYCAVFLGEVFEFYYVVPHWDTMLHFMSGIMLSCLGFILVDVLNKSERVRMQMSPLFIALFAFCFSLACGAVWEIYEYSLDSIMGLNMQKYITAEGVVKAGQEALRDTMKDIIMDALASLIVSIVGFFSIRKHKIPDKDMNN